MRFYVGGYSPEISVCELDTSDGSMKVVGSAPTAQNGSFLAVSKEFGTLYASVESGYDTGSSGRIAAYRIDAKGMLEPIGTAESCGPGPCHLDVDPTRGLLAVANYGGENFGVVELDDTGAPVAPLACGSHTGRSVHPKRQREPHPHATVFSPDYAYLYVCDLGTDEIVTYSSDALASGRAERHSVVSAPRGSGPRHIAFTPDGAFAYLVNELSNTVIAYSVAGGRLTQIDEAPMLPSGFTAETTAAEIALHPSGRHVYASNRGHDSIVVLARAGDGTLSVQGHVNCGGSGPRHFSLDASGRWCVVANQQSNLVASFRIAPDGMMSATGATLRATQPSCALLVG